MANEKFKVKFGLAVGDTTMTVDAATGNIITNGGQSTTDTMTAGGKAIDANGNVLVQYFPALNTTQLPASAFFDNTTANRKASVVVREYGQNNGSLATSATIGNTSLFLEASRGTGTAPTSVNAANTTVGSLNYGYYDGSRWSSENGLGNPVGIFGQTSEATAFETSAFTASISGTTMTVTAVSSGSVHVGQLITGTGVALGTTISAYGTDTFGGVGTYIVSFSQTVASTAMTGVGTTAGGGRIVQVIAPTGNKFSSTTRQAISVTAQTAPTTQTVNTVSVPINASLNLLNGNVESGDNTYVNSAGTVVYKARGGGTFQIPSLNFVLQGIPSQDTCSFTGYIDDGAGGAGNVLTVTAVASGVLYVGQRIYATALSNTTPYFITALGTGTGLTGTYTVASTFQTAGTIVGSSGTPVAMVGSPDDYGLVNKGNQIQFNQSRKSTVLNRRAPLKNGDDIIVISGTAQTGALGTTTTGGCGAYLLNAAEDFTTSARGTRLNMRSVNIGTNTIGTRLSSDSNATSFNTGTFSLQTPSSFTTLQAGDVNIVQMASTWQSALSPGFKYNGLASSGTLTSTGSYFEMSTRWKANSATAVYDPPLNGWGLGRFGFSADSSTNNTAQVNAGSIQSRATEDWDSTATGCKLLFQANRAGSYFNTVNVLDMSPESTEILSDVITLESSNGNNYLVLDGTNATFTNTAGNPLVGNNFSYGRVFGSWFNASETPVITPTALTIGSATYNNIATVGSTTRIIPGAAGKYILNYGFNASQPGGNAISNIEVSLYKNGVIVANTTRNYVIPYDLQIVEPFITGQWMIDPLNTTDYYEIYYDWSIGIISSETISNLTTILTPVGM